MATYVPNVNPYLPELKTFTPDYKFLADALTQRQTKYSTNYKQLNNAYSKIVYTDLSREDTNEARTQFVNNLQPEIEKISGLDLSLAQNVRAAQGVFQPFYDNDLVVKDMVMTKDYKNKVQYAQSLAQSSKQEDNDKYWGEGLELLKYKMDDFINASQEDALKSYIPSYVQNPQLYKRSMAYLKEQGYNVKFDEVSKDGNFIITTKNGKNITATAMADLKMKFLQDDLLNKAYHTKSYVDSRKFADKEMQEGRVSSVSEGVLKYNTGTIQAHQQSTAAKIVQYDEQIATLNSALKSVEAQMKGRTPKPGSSQDLAIKLMQNKLEGTEAQKEMAVNSLTKAVEILNSNSPEAINNQGYSIQMQSNIMKDLGMAARNFSMKNVEKTLKVNQVKMQDRKERHDILLTDMRFKNQARLQKLATGEAFQKLKDKTEYYLSLGLNADGSAKTEDQINAEDRSKIYSNLGLPASDGGMTTQDRIIEQNQNFTEVQEEYMATKVAALDNQSISGYMDAQRILNKDNTEVKNLIKIPEGMDIKNYSSKEIGGDIYVSRENFRKIVNSSPANLNAFKKANKDFFTENALSSAISNLKTEYYNQEEARRSLLKQNQEFNKAQHDNLRTALKLENKDDVPSIYSENEDGTYTHLSEEEYNEKYQPLYQEKILLNKQKQLYPGKNIVGDYGSLIDLDNERLINVSGGNPFGQLVMTKRNKQTAFKPLNSKAWQDLGSGKITPFVTSKGKTIINPLLFETKILTEIEMENYLLKQKSSKKEVKDFIKHFKSSPNQIIENEKDLNFKTFSKFQYNYGAYNYQTKLLDHVNKRTYANEAEGENVNLGFKYINPIANDYGVKDPGAPQADLLIGKGVEYMLDDTQHENPISNAGVLQQGRYLEDALSRDGVIVVQTEKDGGWKTDMLSNEDAKTDVYNMLQKWKAKGLGEKYEYNITYSPAVGDEQYSTYTVDRRQSVAGTIKSAGRKYKQSIKIKVPVHQDYNNKNIKNDQTRYVLNSLIDETTGQHNRKFDNGTNINVTLENGSYKIDFNLFQYEPATDNFISIDPDVLMSQYDIKPYYTNKPGEANQKYLEYVGKASDWNKFQLDNQAATQKQFKSHLLSKYKTEADINALTEDQLYKEWSNLNKK